MLAGRGSMLKWTQCVRTWSYVSEQLPRSFCLDDNRERDANNLVNDLQRATKFLKK
jgi:hypothetical protein